jgi:hypothetical protein
MQDHHAFPSPAGRSPRGNRRGGKDGVADVASWAVALLAARRAGAVARLRPDLLEAFRLAAVDADTAQMNAFLARTVRERVTAAAMADLYIPELARRLGADWMDDRASFAEVSLATARVQAMLRAVGCAWSADAAVPGGTRAVALAVARGEQHTLGAMVLLGQLRRLGVTVRLLLGPVRGEVGRLVRQGGLSGVLISAAGTGNLAYARDIVKEIRKDGPPGLPVVLGGAVLLTDADTTGVVATVGADVVTADLHTALAACGIHIGTGHARLRA